MAEKLDNARFRLPSEFLKDEDLFVDFKTESFTKKRDHDFSFGFGNNSFRLNSDLGSPVDSVERDEDEFIDELARKIADSTLLHPDLFPDYVKNGWKNKNVGIPNSAAEEIERMRMVKERMAFYSTNIFAPTQKPNPVTGSVKNSSTGPGFYPNRSDILYLQLQARQVHLLNQQRMMSRVLGQRRMGCYQFQNEAVSMANWPTLQQSRHVKQQPGSGLRTGFFDATGVKKDRTGTGVFIPRGSRTTNPTIESRKKPGCYSAVSNLDSKPTQNHTTEYDAALKRRNLAMMAQQSRNLRTKQPLMNQELKLPQEWTY